VRNALALSLLSALAGVILSVAPSPSASATSARQMQVPIHLRSIPGSGYVVVYLEISEDFNKLGVPQKLEDVPLTTIPVSRAGILQIKLPVTEEVLENTSSGLADYTFIAWFGNHLASSEASVPVSPEPGNDAAAMRGSIPTIMFSPFERATSQGVPAPKPPPCFYNAHGKSVEKTNLIGQMQDSAARGSKVEWEYSSEADSTFGVGVSNNPTKHFNESGSFTITNSISGSGGFTAGAGFNRFVYGHFYRQRYVGTAPQPFCSYHYKVKFVKSVGDSFSASGSAKHPPVDQYGQCSNDPNGVATMNANGGHWDRDRGKAKTYSSAATIFNLNVSGSTGYTDDIHIRYTDNTKHREYVCGNAQLPDAPILWSNDSQGN
jgi:hypothetical protein